MKIIKVGTIENETKRFECKNCGCIFEADKGEYFMSSQMQILQGMNVYQCQCPTCNRMTDNEVTNESDS